MPTVGNTNKDSIIPPLRGVPMDDEKSITDAVSRKDERKQQEFQQGVNPAVSMQSTEYTTTAIRTPATDRPSSYMNRRPSMDTIDESKKNLKVQQEQHPTQVSGSQVLNYEGAGSSVPNPNSKLNRLTEKIFGKHTDIQKDQGQDMDQNISRSRRSSISSDTDLTSVGRSDSSLKDNVVPSIESLQSRQANIEDNPPVTFKDTGYTTGIRTPAIERPSSYMGRKPSFDHIDPTKKNLKVQHEQHPTKVEGSKIIQYEGIGSAVHNPTNKVQEMTNRLFGTGSESDSADLGKSISERTDSRMIDRNINVGADIKSKQLGNDEQHEGLIDRVKELTDEAAERIKDFGASTKAKVESVIDSTKHGAENLLDTTKEKLSGWKESGEKELSELKEKSSEKWDAVKDKTQQGIQDVKQKVRGSDESGIGEVSKQARLQPESSISQDDDSWTDKSKAKLGELKDEVAQKWADAKQSIEGLKLMSKDKHAGAEVVSSAAGSPELEHKLLNKKPKSSEEDGDLESLKSSQPSQPMKPDEVGLARAIFTDDIRTQPMIIDTVVPQIRTSDKLIVKDSETLHAAQQRLRDWRLSNQDVSEEGKRESLTEWGNHLVDKHGDKSRIKSFYQVEPAHPAEKKEDIFFNEKEHTTTMMGRVLDKILVTLLPSRLTGGKTGSSFTSSGPQESSSSSSINQSVVGTGNQHDEGVLDKVKDTYEKDKSILKDKWESGKEMVMEKLQRDDKDDSAMSGDMKFKRSEQPNILQRFKSSFTAPDQFSRGASIHHSKPADWDADQMQNKLQELKSLQPQQTAPVKSDVPPISSALMHDLFSHDDPLHDDNFRELMVETEE